MLLYIFYGEYKPKNKKKPSSVLRGLHKKLTESRSRFPKHVEECFEDVIDYLDSNPDCKDLLCDMGKDDAPDEYLALVEKGLRKYSKYVFAMGAGCMKSRESWQAVQPWRKIEAYIALARYVYGRGCYKQWDCFSWEDYEERQNLRRTFLSRHLPLSNGTLTHTVFKQFLDDPPAWDAKRVNKKKKFVPKRQSSASGNDPRSDELLVFDVETGMLIPL